MSLKHLNLPEVGDVVISRRKGTKNIKLSVSSAGKVRVSIPSWMPFRAAELYISTNKQWILDHSQNKKSTLITEGVAIGKAHRVSFVLSDTGKIQTRLTHTKVIVKIPPGVSTSTDEVQQKAATACKKALRQESERLLPIRLRALASKHGFDYSSVKVKSLKTRWGSCDSKQNICFNLFLIQLPWDIIDYVIMHELQHTKMMHHKPEFWQELALFVPDLKIKKQILKSKQPILHIKT
jgi:predicted metal-dependent hydrolase